MTVGKKIISLFLVVILILSASALSVSADSTGITELSVITKVGEKD